MSGEENIPEDQNTPVEQTTENNPGTTKEEIPEPTITNNEPPTNMEVHVPHLHHGKKHFKEYFLEFLMLFLAVTLGFFAESLRERVTDRSKEREYMHSMLADLQKDTSNINRSISELNYIINGHDSLENMLEIAVNNNSPEFLRKLYYMNTDFTWNDIGILFTEETFLELKNSGNLRLIESHVLKDSILNYESKKVNCENQHAYSKESISKTYFFATDIFDISCYRKYNDFLNDADYNNRLLVPYEQVKQYISEKPQLLTSDAVLLKKYSRLVNNEKNQFALYLFYIEICRNTAEKLIISVKAEYNFK